MIVQLFDLMRGRRRMVSPCEQAVSAQVHELQRCRELYFREHPIMELVFFYRIVAYETVALVSQHRLEKTDLQSISEVENSEALVSS